MQNPTKMPKIMRATHRGFPGRNSLRPPMNKGPDRGNTAVRTADATTKRSEFSLRVPPMTPHRTEGRGNGKGTGAVEVRDMIAH